MTLLRELEMSEMRLGKEQSTISRDDYMSSARKGMTPELEEHVRLNKFVNRTESNVFSPTHTPGNSAKRQAVYFSTSKQNKQRKISNDPILVHPSVAIK